MVKRIDWIDVAKFYGMFFIYLGHFGTNAGNAYSWVFSFHVPLFFFLAGCLENFNQRGLLQNIKHKAITVLLPFYLFGLLSIVYASIKYNSTLPLKDGFLIILKGGIRNSITYGAGLWFLSCLFVIQIVFSFLKIIIKHKAVVFLICLSAYLAAELIINPRPIVTPHWYYNIDSACYYLIFYCIGWLAYPPINKLLVTTRPTYKTLKVCFSAIAFVYSALLFFGKNLLSILSVAHPLLRAVCNLIKPLPTIWLVIIVSQLFQSKWTKRIGTHSLYMCGSEYLIKSLVTEMLSLVGITLTIGTPIQAYLYSLALLLLTYVLLLPLEKPLLQKLQNVFTRNN